MSALKWVQIDVAFLSGPEARRIARALSVTRQHVVGMWADVWAWAQEHAPDGFVRGADAAELLEDAAEWTGERGAFVRACLECGERPPLDATPDGLRIRGMDRYARALRSRLLEAERKRQKRAGDSPRPPDIGRTLAGHDTDIARTLAGRPPDVREMSVSPSPSTSLSVASKGGVGGNDAQADAVPSGGVPFVERLLAAWQAARGYALSYDPFRHDVLLRELGTKHGMPEVEKRWGFALTYEGFPVCGGFADLKKHWDRYGRPEKAPKPKPGTGTLDSQDFREGHVPGWGKPKAGGAT